MAWAERRGGQLPSDRRDSIPVGARTARNSDSLDGVREKSERRPTPTFSLATVTNTWVVTVVAIVVVVGTAAFAVCRLREAFGKTDITRVGSGLASDTKPFNPKRVTYEVFGADRAVATINYLDLDAQPQKVRDATLPWSLTLTTTAAAASATIVAQGDSDSIGCRIKVDGELKNQNAASGVNAQTFCLVKSA
jgi:Mycobacterium membrane protein